MYRSPCPAAFEDFLDAMFGASAMSWALSSGTTYRPHDLSRHLAFLEESQFSHVSPRSCWQLQNPNPESTGVAPSRDDWDHVNSGKSKHERVTSVRVASVGTDRTHLEPLVPCPDFCYS